MNEFQYCYWLMGVFELGNPKELNETQLDLVKKHLDLVEHRQYGFCNWLSGFLDASEEKELSSTQLTKVLEKLRFEFLTVIDKSYPLNIQDALSAAHEGKKIPAKVVDNKPKFEAMC